MDIKFNSDESLEVEFGSENGVTFDLNENRKVVSNNFGILDTVIQPDYHFKKMLSKTRFNKKGIFHFVAKKTSEKKSLINAIEQDLISELIDKYGNSYPDYYVLTKKGKKFFKR